ncbi:Uncharacterised protein [uncultured archaeon]|nr:Uncharacterised protein [uncultured archaeon]
MKKLILLSLFLFFGSFVLAAEANQTYSAQDALIAINNSEKILNEFINLSLPYSDINDTIVEAKNVYIQVLYAQILRGEVNSSLQERIDARSALQFINWKNLQYSDVVALTNRVSDIRSQTLDLYDLLNLEQKKLSDPISNETSNYFLLARDSFYNGRLNESQTYLESFRTSYDSEYGNNSIFKSLALQARNFFYRYWIQITIFIVILIFFTYFVYVKLRIRFLRMTVRKLHSEKSTLSELIKKAQTDRFKENKISALTYNVRTSSYHERLQKINSSLPVLENRLKKLSKV